MARRSARALLEVAGLCGVAVTQPILAVFGDAPDWFVFHGATSSTIVAFALVVALVPPLVVWAVVQLVGIGSEGRRRLALHAAVGALTGLVVLQVAAAADVALVLGVILAVAAGAAAGWAHARWASVRLWTAWLSPAPLVFAALFLFASPVSGLVGGDDIDTADLGAFGSGDPPPVVFVVLDEWPLASIVRQDGTIDADLYPNVAELAAGSTWYRDTTTVANLTNFAVPALLTGNRPEDGDTADASTHPENLFTLLGGTYRLDVTERITRLCPTSLCGEGGGGVDRDDGADLSDLLAEAGHVYADRLTPGERAEPVTDVFVEPEAAVDEARDDSAEEDIDDLLERRPETLNRFLDGIQADEEPTLHFLHLLAPHTPHRHLPDGHRYDAGPELRAITPLDGTDAGDRRSLAEAPVRLDRQRLQLEVAHVDELLGDLLDRLHETGLYDDALVVVTSDHGIAFRPGAEVRGLGSGPISAAAQPELLWIPLFIKAPGQAEGEVADTPAESIDILPTMAGRLGIDLPWDVDGIDLAGAPATRSRSFSHVEGSSFATFHVDDPTPVDADLDDVLGLGVDSVLRGSGPDRWWQVGPRTDLLGQFPLGPRLNGEIDDFDQFLDVDLDDTVLPVVVSGRVDADQPRVAVAVNGEIAAVTDTYRDPDGGGRFAVLVPPDSLVDGVNRITLHQPGPRS
jgi:hypothetical protein